MVKVIHKLVGERKIKYQDKDDVRSQLFYKIKRDKLMFDNEQKLIGWIYKSYYNVANNVKGKEVNNQDEVFINFQLIGNEDMEAIKRKLIVYLNEDEYEIVNKLLEGYTYRDISKHPQKTKRIIDRIRKKLIPVFQ